MTSNCSDKSEATTYALVHRPQNDPRIHDDPSNSMVFQEVPPGQSHKIKDRSTLETELFGDTEAPSLVPSVRENEGEAAEHGVYFDDTEYDYMQHLRDLNAGDGSSESYLVEAPIKKKGKGKMRLEDALRETSLEDKVSQTSSAQASDKAKLLDDEILPSKILKRTTYQDQQDVPDALAGFQPDMDPRLREVLEALDDDAYVDDEEDFFGELAKERKEVSLAEFEELGFMDDEDVGEDGGWETDDTAQPSKEYKSSQMSSMPSTADIIMGDEPDHGDEGWMKEFSKFKKAEKSEKTKPQAVHSEVESSIMTSTSMTGGRRKKRKGAMTSSTGYSMTSSVLARTDGQTLLDARFDRIEEDYAEDDMDDGDGGRSVMTGISATSSQAPSSRMDFDSIMDDFLGGYSMSGKKRLKKGGHQSGMEQLDEIRKGLGPARLKVQRAS